MCSQRVVGVVIALWATILAQFGTCDEDVQLEGQTTNASESRDALVSNPNEQTSVRGELQSWDDLVDTTKFDSRMAHTIALRKFLARSDVEELQQYWEKSHSLRAHALKKQVQAGIIQRWTVLDPVSAFTFVNEQLTDSDKSSLFDLVFREWSVSNLDDALSHAAQLDQQGKETALRSILIAREDLSIAERREFARELDSDWLAVEILAEVLDARVLSDPKREWETFISRHEDRLQELSSEKFQLLTEIAHAWIARDGLAVFQKMQASLPIPKLLSEVTRSATLKLVVDNPQLAFDFGLDVYFREQTYRYRALVRELVSRWAQLDPKSTFDATLTVNASVLRRELQKATLTYWARNDSRELLSNLETFPEDSHDLIREIAIIEMAEKTQETISEVLLGIDDRQHRRSVAMRLAYNWAQQDIVAVLSWIEADESVLEFKSDVKRAAFREFARSEPRLAFQTAIAQPISGENNGLEATVIDSIARWHSLDTAVSMLPHVRSGTTRVKAYDAVIEQSLSEHDSERAIELFLELCDHETSSTSGPVETVAEELPVHLFENIDHISSEVMRASVAQELFRQYGDDDIFNRRQLAKLKKISQSSPSSSLLEGLEGVIDSIQRSSE